MIHSDAVAPESGTDGDQQTATISRIHSMAIDDIHQCLYFVNQCSLRKMALPSSYFIPPPFRPPHPNLDTQIEAIHSHLHILFLHTFAHHPNLDTQIEAIHSHLHILFLHTFAHHPNLDTQIEAIHSHLHILFLHPKLKLFTHIFIFYSPPSLRPPP